MWRLLGIKNRISRANAVAGARRFSLGSEGSKSTFTWLCVDAYVKPAVRYSALSADAG